MKAVSSVIGSGIVMLGFATLSSVACNAASDGRGSLRENGAGGGAGFSQSAGASGAGGAVSSGGVVGRGGSVGSGGASTGGAIPFIGNGGIVGAGGSATGGQAFGGLPGGGVPGAGGFGVMAGMTGAGGASVSGGAAGAGAMGGAAAGAGGCEQDLKCMPAAPSTGDIYADCFARVNQFRACACLPALQRWKDGEACANQDAMYDATNQSAGAHAGFKANICQAGFAQDECPGYPSNNFVISTCLQQMWNEGPPPMMPCSGTCYEQHGHFINMTGKYTQVACGFFTNTDGKIWAVQNFK